MWRYSLIPMHIHKTCIFENAKIVLKSNLNIFKY